MKQTYQKPEITSTEAFQDLLEMIPQSAGTQSRGDVYIDFGGDGAANDVVESKTNNLWDAWDD